MLDILAEQVILPVLGSAAVFILREFIWVFGLYSADPVTSAGTDRDAKDHCCWTPLHFAAREGHADCVELLLKTGLEQQVPRSRHGSFCGAVERRFTVFVLRILRRTRLQAAAPRSRRSPVLQHGIAPPLNSIFRFSSWFLGVWGGGEEIRGNQGRKLEEIILDP